eukprot:gene15141-21201_t
MPVMEALGPTSLKVNNPLPLRECPWTSSGTPGHLLKYLAPRERFSRLEPSATVLKQCSHGRCSFSIPPMYCLLTPPMYCQLTPSMYLLHRQPRPMFVLHPSHVLPAHPSCVPPAQAATADVPCFTASSFVPVLHRQARPDARSSNPIPPMYFLLTPPVYLLHRQPRPMLVPHPPHRVPDRAMGPFLSLRRAWSSDRAAPGGGAAPASANSAP